MASKIIESKSQGKTHKKKERKKKRCNKAESYLGNKSMLPSSLKRSTLGIVD